MPGSGCCGSGSSGRAARREGSRREWADDLARTGLGPLGRNFPGGALLVFDEQLRFLAAGGGGLADVGLSRQLIEGKTLAAAFGAGR